MIRRVFTVTAGLLLVLAGCAGQGGETEAEGTSPPASESPGAAREPSELLVNINPATEKSFDQYIVPRMKELYNVDVVVSKTISGEALATAIAQKDDPQISVFGLDEGPWLQGKEAGLWAELDEDRIPTLQEIPDKYKDDDGAGATQGTVLLGLIYDEEAVADAGLEPPTSLYDLWDPAYEGRVSIQQFSSSFAYALLVATTLAEGGDPEQSFDAGFEKLADIKSNVLTFHGPAAHLIQLFTDGEIWLGWGMHPTAILAAEAGAPVRWVAPNEGAMSLHHMVAIAEGAPNQEAAELLVDMMMSPEYQELKANLDYHAPVHPDAQPEEDFSAVVTDEALENAIPIPQDLYNEQRVELNERYQREVES